MSSTIFHFWTLGVAHVFLVTGQLLFSCTTPTSLHRYLTTLQNRTIINNAIHGPFTSCDLFLFPSIVDLQFNSSNGEIQVNVDLLGIFYTKLCVIGVPTIPQGPMWHLCEHACSPHAKSFPHVSTHVGTSSVHGISKSVSMRAILSSYIYVIGNSVCFLNYHVWNNENTVKICRVITYRYNFRKHFNHLVHLPYRK